MVRTKRKHVWVELPTVRGPISIQLSARHAEVLHPTTSPVSIVATSSGGRRKGAINLAVPTLWSSQLLERVKLALEGPEVALTSKGLAFTAGSVTLTTITRNRGTVDVKLSLDVDRVARLLLARGSRLLRRVMPLVGLGVHLRFLRRDVQKALAATKESGNRLDATLCWVRVAGDVIAIPYPAVGIASESVAWLVDFIARPSHDDDD